MAPAGGQAPNRQFSLLPKVVNGGIAGIVGVTCVFPMDLVKTRLQNQQKLASGKPMYNGIADCFRKSLAGGGLRGMYQGSGVNLLLITPEKAIKLVANDFFRFHLRKKDGQLPIFRQMIAGGAAGFCQIVVTTPMELLKIQLQDAGRTSKSAQGGKVTATQVTLNLLREKGIMGLYRGLGSTMARDVSFSVIYFPLFATLDKLGPRKSDGSGDAVFWATLTAGLTSGAFSSLCVTPLDVVKTRLQLIKRAEGEAAYKGLADAFIRIYREEGVKALFKGGLVRMMVMAPLFGIAQVVYFVGAAEFLMGIDKSKQVRH